MIITDFMDTLVSFITSIMMLFCFVFSAVAFLGAMVDIYLSNYGYGGLLILISVVLFVIGYILKESDWW